MIEQGAVKAIYTSIIFLIGIHLSAIRIAHASEFEIDEIITAIKNDINTANISEIGNPKFTIETVKVALTVDSTETEKGAIAVKIVGLSNGFEDEPSTSKSYHNLSFYFSQATHPAFPLKFPAAWLSP